MAQVRNEIYDDNGLVRVEFIEVDEIPIETQIAEKEAQLIAIYEEIQRLKTI
jgi:hypothetical protein